VTSSITLTIRELSALASEALPKCTSPLDLVTVTVCPYKGAEIAVLSRICDERAAWDAEVAPSSGGVR